MPAVPGSLVAAVTALVDDVARTVVTPRFRDLASGDVREKGPGDLVTVADLEAEAALTAGLAQIEPGVPVVGEEAVAADPSVLDLLTAPRVWVVDPIDGTQAFVDGLPDHAVMVGLVEHGEAVGGWICLPQHDRTWAAVRGGGAWRTSGGRTVVAERPSAPGDADLRGAAAAMLRRRPGMRQELPALLQRLGPGVRIGPRMWSGATYDRFALGEQDVALYGRAQPWDHVPGAALVRELGGRVVRLDGSDYRPGTAGEDLLVAATPAVAERVLRTLAEVSGPVTR